METLLGEPSAERIAAPAIELMRAAIRDAGGREVFFAGILTADGRVDSVEVKARGHGGAVNAIFADLPAGGVVIHNHPSGNLEPSDADLDLAAGYSRNGFGVYIVDNAVERLYAVVEPMRPEQVRAVEPSGLDRYFAADGPLAAQFDGFEERPQQREMMRAVAEAFNRSGIAAIEAPTGVGKTLAYLIPAVTWALDNRERVLVSTRTINLQEQIVHKDIPVLQRALDRPFKAVLVKGRQNYLCRRRLERALAEAELFDDSSERDTLEALANWAEKTDDGSLSDLGFVPDREIWDRVCSDSDTCTPSQCQEQGNCFLSRARRSIAQADIVVVNHHMLFSDLAIKRELGDFSALAVLPAFSRLIIDEAHHVEDSATEYFGSQAAQLGALYLLGRLLRKERGHERGALLFLSRKLGEIPGLAERETAETLERLIEDNIRPAVVAVREGLVTAFQAVRAHVADRCRQIGRDIKWRLTPDALADPDLREIHRVYILPAAEEAASLAQSLYLLAEKLSDFQRGLPDERSFSMDIQQLRAYSERLLRLSNTIAEATSADFRDNTVRWVEIDATKSEIVRLISCPLDVAKTLNEWVYPNLKTLIMTSATLAVGQRFDFYFQRSGLDRVAGRPLESIALDSPFDYAEQALLCIPDDLPPPDAPEFAELSVQFMGEVLLITGGRAFVLFTSYGSLNHAFSRLERELRAAGITPLKQGADSRTRLLERFRAHPRSVLFGTDSFWEGVDVVGDALQCVILPRLPFRVPTEPVLEARAEAIEAAGGNAFTGYATPLAVIKLRQGIGRLIRSRNDRGSVVVLDGRILTRNYGRTFLSSLPPMPRCVGPREQVAEALSTFHRTLSRAINAKPDSN
jgi:ATP-dependent DNA helicase DinG